METLIIDNSTVQAQKFINFARTLPFVECAPMQIETPKKSIYQAIEESNATTVDVFFDELDSRIKKRFRNG